MKDQTQFFDKTGASLLILKAEGYKASKTSPFKLSFRNLPVGMIG